VQVLDADFERLALTVSDGFNHVAAKLEDDALPRFIAANPNTPPARLKGTILQCSAATFDAGEDGSSLLLRINDFTSVESEQSYPFGEPKNLEEDPEVARVLHCIARGAQDEFAPTNEQRADQDRLVLPRWDPSARTAHPGRDSNMPLDIDSASYPVHLLESLPASQPLDDSSTPRRLSSRFRSAASTNKKDALSSRLCLEGERIEGDEARQNDDAPIADVEGHEADAVSAVGSEGDSEDLQVRSRGGNAIWTGEVLAIQADDSQEESGAEDCSLRPEKAAVCGQKQRRCIEQPCTQPPDTQEESLVDDSPQEPSAVLREVEQGSQQPDTQGKSKSEAEYNSAEEFGAGSTRHSGITGIPDVDVAVESLVKIPHVRNARYDATSALKRCVCRSSSQMRIQRLRAQCRAQHASKLARMQGPQSRLLRSRWICRRTEAAKEEAAETEGSGVEVRACASSLPSRTCRRQPKRWAIVMKQR
jgi:hypothetical protein